MLASFFCCQGHLLELKFFLKEPTGFDLYEGSYVGGHVERELEELADNWMLLAEKSNWGPIGGLRVAAPCDSPVFPL